MVDQSDAHSSVERDGPRASARVGRRDEMTRIWEWRFLVASSWREGRDVEGGEDGYEDVCGEAIDGGFVAAVHP